MVSRRQEALQRFMAVMVVNKDRIPPEVITEIMKAWEEYIAAFAEDALATMEGLVSKRAEEL